MNPPKFTDNAAIGEVSGVFLLGLVESFQNLSNLPQGGLNLPISNLDPAQWYPHSLLIDALHNIKKAFPSENLLFRAGVNFLRIWYENGPGKTMIHSSIDWLHANDESGGYNSVVRGGSKDEIGWCLLKSIDEEAGIAVFENVMPILPDFVRGVFYGGCILFDDMEYVEVDATTEHYEPNPSFNKIIITVRFRLKSNTCCQNLDERISTLQAGSTLALSQEEIQSLIWRYKGLRYSNGLDKQYYNEINDVLSDSIQRVRIAATAFETQEGMVITDANGIIVQINHAFTRMTGYTHEDIAGKNPHILNSGCHDEEFFRKMWSSIKNYDYWSGEIWNRRKNGEVFPEFLTITAVKNVMGNVTNYVASYTDITLRKQAEEKIHALVFYDALTKLPNRRLLNDRLIQAMAASNRSDCYGALMFLDLDNFKPLNDTYGHAVGDLLLIEVASRLKTCIRESDTAARFGGDEFVVLLNTLDTEREIAIAQAGIIAEKIRAALSEPYNLTASLDGSAGNIAHHCTATIGVAIFFGHECSSEDILRWADGAMYAAKGAGRNQIRFHKSKTE